jgi:aryl-alcohol dehydrogenase-like predicted oxidoreductase
LRRFADERGRTLVEVAFGWLASRAPVSSIIAGATTPEQIDANVAAASWRPGEADLAELDRITAADA